MREQRYPTRAELDRVAPKHPVIFATGPDASLNSLALNLSGIDREFQVTDGGTGFAEKDPTTGAPTGILRNCTRFVKVQSALRPPSRTDKVRRLKELFADYNGVGITSVCDRDASLDEIETYKELRRSGGMTLRVSLSQHIESIGALASILESIRQASRDPLFTERDDWLRLIGIKTFLDGGMLTGSAYLRQPWGVSEIYSISDPNYRGVRFILQERLVTMVHTARRMRLAVHRALCFGNHLAWIGMVLVHPDYRRRGIGSALLQHCLDHLRQRHIACIKLDATPLGKPVYEKLGFQT